MAAILTERANATNGILLADHVGNWRTAVAEGLQASRYPVLVVDDGAHVLRALTDPSGAPAVVIVGTELRGLGGVDALFLAERSGTQALRAGVPVRTVFLVTDVRHDVELLDSLRARGVNDFLYREDPVIRTIDRVLANFLPDRRAGVRSAVRLDVAIRVRDMQITGSMYDLTLAGAQLVVKAEQVGRSVPSVGESLHLRFAFCDTQVDCSAVVRRLSMQESFIGKRIVLGVQFVPLDEPTQSSMEMILAGATEELEMARRG